MYRLICVVGARPNFMKIAPICEALNRLAPEIEVLLLHTGQHYDDNMKRQFFEQLGIPEPDVDLGVGSGTHTQQTADIMKGFEPVLMDYKPHAILVVGDVNSTIACALVAVKNNVPVIHVEAGLRSYDREMPEEINRVLTDQISGLLYTTEASAADNLAKEGIGSERVEFVGNVMIDTLKNHVGSAVPVSDTLANQSKVDPNQAFGLVTLHRPSNVDDKTKLTALVDTLVQISTSLPLVFPVHPRTRSRMKEFYLQNKLNEAAILLLEPLGYMQMLGLMASAKLVLTDSGGIQEETTALGVPCVTLRENTERPITVEQGTNTLVGTEPESIIKAVDEIIANGGKQGRQPELWDGKAAERIASHLAQWIKQAH